MVSSSGKMKSSGRQHSITIDRSMSGRSISLSGIAGVCASVYPPVWACKPCMLSVVLGHYEAYNVCLWPVLRGVGLFYEARAKICLAIVPR